LRRRRDQIDLAVARASPDALVVVPPAIAPAQFVSNNPDIVLVVVRHFPAK
jgi:hypothetical protein